MRLIDRIIKKLEDDAVMYSSIGMEQEAKEAASGEQLDRALDAAQRANNNLPRKAEEVLEDWFSLDSARTQTLYSS